MTRRPDAARLTAMAAEMDRVRDRDPDMFVDACRIVQELSPLAFSKGMYPDEFEPEVTTILLRLGGARRASEAIKVVHGSFIGWFGEETAGGESGYIRLGEALWSRWQDSPNRP